MVGNKRVEDMYKFGLASEGRSSGRSGKTELYIEPEGKLSKVSKASPSTSKAPNGKDKVSAASTSNRRLEPRSISHDKHKYAEEDVEDSETESEESDVSGSDEPSWISWFCALRGNEFFCEVDDDFIQDDFNLSGLSNQVPYYEYALDLILDVEVPTDDMLTEEQNEMVESAAEMLYGLIHVRYILTGKGMSAMHEKYNNVDFGRCPRVFCGGQHCLPVGQSDIPRQCTVNIFCPKCEDIYFPRSKYQGNIDGAYFGTTFPHLFVMTYHPPAPKPSHSYVPKIYGFKIHKSAK